MKRYMRNKDVKRSGGMSGGGGCSLGSVPAAFTCTTTTTHPPAEASLEVSRQSFIRSPITYQRRGSTGPLPLAALGFLAAPLMPTENSFAGQSLSCGVHDTQRGNRGAGS